MLSLGNLSSGGAASGRTANLRGEGLDARATSTQRVYRLCYDAATFEHETTTLYITIPGRLQLVRIQDEPTGKLGLFTSKNRAKTKGREWLYEQLSRLNEQTHLPLHYRQDGEFFERPQPGTWRRTGWVDDMYTILDEGRYHEDYADVSLSVTIQEEDLDPLDDGQGYKTDDADEDVDFGPGKGRVAAGIAGTQARAA